MRRTRRIDKRDTSELRFNQLVELERMMSMGLAADTGGTFTDMVAFSYEDQRLLTAKSLTTYDDPMRGVMRCIAGAGVDIGGIEWSKFGTTLVINALLERRGARCALLCTRGFRDTLEIRRGNRVQPFDLHYKREPELVPRELRFEINERISANGEILQAVDAIEVANVADQLQDLNLEAVAVSFINSYVDDRHEKEVAEILRAKLPDLYITTGTELSRQWYEYERTSTAAANAFVGPLIGKYIGRMERGLADAGCTRPIYLMASNGGVLSAQEARRQPIQLVESGPVGGCLGAAAYAKALGIPSAIAFDMGGTTAKCAVVENGEFEIRNPYYVGGYAHGFPVHGAVVDIVEVGAGGGSIASVDGQQRLSVGPRSAGSTPGPACYGLGGLDPTITDANVLLGRISPVEFLGGDMTLDERAARDAVYERVGKPLGYRPDEGDLVAQGILDIGILAMSNALAQVTVERGLDPRDFALIAFGGNGPVHGSDLARRLAIPLLIIPPYPGVFSALGMLLADARLDEHRTFLADLDDLSVAAMNREFADMADVASGRLPNDDAENVRVQRFAELRFKGQRHAHKVNLPCADDARTVRAAFLASYMRQFGHGDGNSDIEFVSLAITLMQSVSELDLKAISPVTGLGDPAYVLRDVYFRSTGRRMATKVFKRSALPTGFEINGPAIVEEYTSSTIVGPSDRLTVGDLGELRLEIRE